MTFIDYFNAIRYFMNTYFEIGSYIINPWQLAIFSIFLASGARLYRRFRR